MFYEDTFIYTYKEALLRVYIFLRASKNSQFTEMDIDSIISFVNYGIRNVNQTHIFINDTVKPVTNKLKTTDQLYLNLKEGSLQLIKPINYLVCFQGN